MYSQKSFPQKLGTSKYSIASQGCFLVSLTNWLNFNGVSKMNPLELNELLIQKGGYTNQCMMNAPKVASLFNLTYEKTTKKPDLVCIGETDHYKKQGVPQHFFLSNNGQIVDPLDKEPDWKKNNYNIVSYRVFKSKAVPKVEVKRVEIKEPLQSPIIEEKKEIKQVTTQEVKTPEKAELKATDDLVDKLITKLINFIKTIWTNSKKG